jgi:hypothetical protein
MDGKRGKSLKVMKEPQMELSDLEGAFGDGALNSEGVALDLKLKSILLLNF